MGCKYTHILFDLDGTMTESGPGILNSVQYALRHYGIEETDMDKLRLFVGPPLVDSFMNLYGFSSQKAHEAVFVYREYFSDKGIFENSLYEGIEDLLKSLKSAGKKLYVATGKPEIFLPRILEHFDIAKYFDYVCGSDADEKHCQKWEIIENVICHEHLEPLVKSGNVLMVGDRKHDTEGAIKNNIPCAGVLYGYGTREELSRNGATYILATVKELKEFLLNN